MTKSIKAAHDDLKTAVGRHDAAGAREALNEIAKHDPAEARRIEEATIANAIRRRNS